MPASAKLKHKLATVSLRESSSAAEIQPAGWNAEADGNRMPVTAPLTAKLREGSHLQYLRNGDAGQHHAQVDDHGTQRGRPPCR